MKEVFEEAYGEDKHPVDTRPLAAFSLEAANRPDWFGEWRKQHYADRWGVGDEDEQNEDAEKQAS